MTIPHSFRYKFLPLILTFIFVGSILYFHASQRLDDFKQYQSTLSTTSSIGLANQVKYIINEKKRLVALFANQNADLLKQYAFNHESEALYREISNRIKKVFPDYFAFTITDAKGNPYPPDFDNFIGDLCISDIKKFHDKDNHLPRIHPNMHQYHYDIISKINHKTFNAILLISFSPKNISELIKNIQLPNHQLMLVRKTDNLLIEVFEQGARNKLSRNNYNFSEDEQNHILSSHPIEGTDWHSIDMFNDALFTNNKIDILNQSFIIIIMLLIVMVMSFYFIQKLFKANKKLAHEQEKQDFIATISHELRSPLTSINGSLQLIYNITSNNEKTQNLAKIGIQGCSRILRLINNLLDSYKLKTNELSIYIQPTNIIEVIQSAVDEMQSYAESYQSTLTFNNNTDKETIIANVDPERIIQVLINLISNAIKYGSKHDHVSVSIHMQKNKVRIEVTDHGPGIPLKDQNTVFEKFSDTTTKSYTAHTSSAGLGLSISKNIISRHNGIINFISQEKTGTTFYIILPL